MYARTSILLMLPSFSTIGSNPNPLKIASRNLYMFSSPLVDFRGRYLYLELTCYHQVPFRVQQRGRIVPVSVFLP